MEVDTEQSTQPQATGHAGAPTQNKAVIPEAPSRATTEDLSFVSAKEKLGSKNNSMENVGGSEQSSSSEQVALAQSPQIEAQNSMSTAAQSSRSQQPVEAPAQTESPVRAQEDVAEPMDLDDERSVSEASSPEKPLLRKSSLTFASLPAREPLNGKQSIGNRISRTSHLEQYKASGFGRSSQLGRATGEKSLGASHGDLQDEEDQSDTENTRPALSRIESETTKLHNKTSTQRLHDAISKLGQTKEPRPSKSIPNFATQRPSTVTYPNLSNAGEKTGPMERPAVPLKDDVPTARVVQQDDEEDDWIAPVRPTNTTVLYKATGMAATESIADDAESGKATVDPYALRLPQQRSPDHTVSPPRTYGHVKSISASAMPSPTKPGLAVSTLR